MMNEKNLCPKCGAALPANAPEGLCPRCLGALTLEPETVVSGAEAAAAWTPPPASELEPLFPQLELLGLIGRGGMGVVYKARQKELDRIVALKVLPPGIGSDPAFAERFAREAKALARLNHPGIVTVHDFGRADGLFYFLMEFVDGVSLRQLMNTGRVSPREALAIVPQICDALQYAHDQGIVHRDIKPENILLDRQGRVKVADFGLAKLMLGRDALPRRPGEDERTAGPGVPIGLTEAGKVMGTPQYMAPEQAERPSEVDHRADIYALGIVFYQMLTGELPGRQLEPPSRKVRIDVRLDEVVLRALEKEPERRYQQVSEVKTAVETIVNSGSEVTPSSEQGETPPARFSWVGALPRYDAPLIVKRGNRRVLNWPAIGMHVLWYLAVIFVLLPVFLKGMSVNEKTADLMQLLLVGLVVVSFGFRLVRGFRSPLESPPPDRDAERTGLLYVGAVLVLLAASFCWYQFGRASRAQSGKPLTRQHTTADVASVGHALRLANVVKRVPATNGPAPEANASTDQSAALPPTVEQILAWYAEARGEMAGPDKTRTLAIKGTFTSRDRLGTMEAEALIKAPDKWTQILKGTNGLVWQRGFDGSAAWEVSKWGGPDVDPAIVLLGRVLVSLYRGDPLTPLLPQMRFKGQEPIGGAQAYVVEVALPGQSPRLWFDTKTGLLVRTECGAGSIVMQMDWEDYRDIGGLMVPFRVREAGTENWTIECSEVKLNEPIDDAAFARPASH